MVLGVLYVWCQLNLDSLITYWLVDRSRAVYFPWVILTLNTSITGSGMSELVGILVGHAYYFLRHRYPDDFNCSPPLSCCMCGFPITDGGGLRQRQRWKAGFQKSGFASVDASGAGKEAGRKKTFLEMKPG